MWPNHVRKEFSAGTVHGPERLTSPTPRTAADCLTAPTAAVAGRSEVSGTSSERITALAAASMRSVNCSSVSRPSAAASRRRSTVASRSASEARTSIRGSSARPRDEHRRDEALVRSDEQRESLVVGHLLLRLFGGPVHVVHRWPDVWYASSFLRHDDRDRITRAAAGTASGAEVRRGHRPLAGDHGADRGDGAQRHRGGGADR